MKDSLLHSRGALRRLKWAALILATVYSAPGLTIERPDRTYLHATGDTDRIIVKYKTVTLSAQNALPQREMSDLSARAGQHLRHVRHMRDGAHVLKMDRHYRLRDLNSMMQKLRADPNVEYVEPDVMMRPMFDPNDAYYSLQWHYFEPTAGINLPPAWDVTNGAGVVVAVLDTGYRPHADLAANILPGYDMISDTFISNDGDRRDSDATDPGDWMRAGACGGGYPPQDYDSSWHGTHTAGTIAAVTNNGIGVAGVAFGAKILPVRVLGVCGGYTSDIADGIVWAAGGSVSGVPANQHPAQVINMSLGGGGTCGYTFQNAINTARALGTTIVVAAGNEGINAANSSPANCNGVITVAAVTRSGGRAYYSNYGSVVDIAAPGGDTRTTGANGIVSTVNDGTTSPGNDIYAYYQGTSMASPHVAGVAALVYAANPGISPDEMESLLKNTARAFPSGCSQCGAGIVDAAAAVTGAGAGAGAGGGAGGDLVETDLSGSRRSWHYFTVDVPAGSGSLRVDMSNGSGDADLYVRFGSQPTTSRYDCRPEAIYF